MQAGEQRSDETPMTGQRFRVSHRTTYEYSLPMNDGYTLAIVMPRPTPLQTVERVDVDGGSGAGRARRAPSTYSATACCSWASTTSTTGSLWHAMSEVTVEPIELDGAGPAWEDVASSVAEMRGPDALDVRPFAGGVSLVSGEHETADLRALASPAFLPGRPIVEAARALCSAIHEQFDYDHAFTEVSTPLATVLTARRGVCQDFAHLAIGALRMFGLPARYVSGYVETRRSGEQRRGADASHAWCCGVGSRSRLGRLRSDQRASARRVPRDRGVGSRLRRRRPGAWRRHRPARIATTHRRRRRHPPVGSSDRTPDHRAPSSP